MPIPARELSATLACDILSAMPCGPGPDRLTGAGLH
ncbi:hypothetical protein LMG31886_27850 [Xanthomonas hydrangeae]|nr:hypothetical protein LMG31884_28600 [Xanthomonas hydrangeae]CAD7718526.1 hypothetical protein LMG31884_28600 [Xanthomonas hydrangeae]CAD7735678.1 hypothetical protein LMG31887_28500 [Xanthomonas hydrangeae]CAD7735681.1 hypothetical protein LMG31887_28500 [Xanthomonas hydrangeae]CAD7738563.1 hypothetical protein LMG31886_27850 [Xanthomonas hydrangeae]